MIKRKNIQAGGQAGTGSEGSDDGSLISSSILDLTGSYFLGFNWQNDILGMGLGFSSSILNKETELIDSDQGDSFRSFKLV